MRYAFHPEALAEYAEAVQYYVEQRVEVAQAFIDAVEDAIYRLRESPTRYIAIDEDVRRCMTRRFPYGILYTIEALLHEEGLRRVGDMVSFNYHTKTTP